MAGAGVALPASNRKDLECVEKLALRRRDNRPSSNQSNALGMGCSAKQACRGLISNGGGENETSSLSPCFRIENHFLMWL